MSGLSDALTIDSGGEGEFVAFADPDHESISGMFGGWTAAVSLEGVIAAGDGGLVPSAFTINFVAPIAGGATVSLKVGQIGGGRSVQHWRVDAISVEGAEVYATCTVVMAARRPSDGHVQSVMPEAPDPDGLGEFHAPAPQGDQTLIRPISGTPPFGLGDTRSVHWIRSMDGRTVDYPQLAYLADQMAPRSFFWSEGPRPSATLTMSMHFHGTANEIASIGDDYLLVDTIGTRGESSTSGHHATIWSREGVMLATSEQLCWFR
jgi:acyl-CoA thioesterase